MEELLQIAQSSHAKSCLIEGPKTIKKESYLLAEKP